MIKRYFGTDGIRGSVNQNKINGDMFFKFGLAAGTYFRNLKKKKNFLHLSFIILMAVLMMKLLLKETQTHLMTVI